MNNSEENMAPSNTSEPEDMTTNEVNHTNSNTNLLSNLEKIEDTATYFLIHNCLGKFYNENDYEDISFDLIDSVVIETLNLNENNTISLENSGFCIDEIYQQKLTETENIYVVYYRLGQSAGNIADRVAWVRINSENSVFSIYPYEYLNFSNQLHLKEEDTITIDNIKEIEKNENNGYEPSAITTDDASCVKELFRRYKFDLLLDLNHLYNTLEEEYKNAKFENIESLEQYVESNRTDLYLDTISQYNVSKTNESNTYTIVSDGENEYIFYVTNLMEYTILMDNYTIVTIQDTYQEALPNAQAKYCINRIIEAINDKNYEFVYERLNPIQKNNYYRSLSDFENFVKNSFFTKNNYEIDEEYLIISTYVYQYRVKIMDNSNGGAAYKYFTMTVNLQNEDNFTISIVSI